MEMTEFRGIRIGLVRPSEAVATDWTPYRTRVDVVRVEHPPAECWDALTSAGFLPKPFLVTWVAPVKDDDEKFLAGLARKERQTIRAARQRVARENVRLTVEPVDDRLLDAFLPVYAQRVAEMRHGWAVAVEQRAMILEEADRHFAVCAYDGQALVGCSLGWHRPHLDIVQLRFSAVDAAWRDAALARVLYLAAAEETRRRGVGTISLGMDPNLYGHIAKPGLFRFKSRLGFVPMPSQLVDPATGVDHADLLLTLDRLDDPSFTLAYAGASPGPELRMEIFSRHRDVDVCPLRAAFITGYRTHRLS